MAHLFQRRFATPGSRLSRRGPSGHSLRSLRGLSLVEVLLCVAIGAMLLTSVAVAFRASFNSFKDSQQRGQMLNAARSFMNRITADIRMCDAAAPYDPTSAVSNAENSQFNNQIVPGYPNAGLSSAGGSGTIGIQLLKTHADSWDPLASPTNPVIITYWLDSTKTQIMMTRKMGSAAPTPYVICNFVQSLQIYMVPVYVPPNPQAGTSASVVLRRAVITTTFANKDSNGTRILADGGQDLTLTFSDAAVPRRSFPGL